MEFADKNLLGVCYSDRVVLDVIIWLAEGNDSVSLNQIIEEMEPSLAARINRTHGESPGINLVEKRDDTVKCPENGSTLVNGQISLGMYILMLIF